ncbi:cilia- and flagella-associated protein 206 [Ostrinia furnacalis]|uniref:cilia- and flagella-associated protein 206 n=1 Tax=Ostrinia furnacalis TaxID=93504 RepID=UPI00103982E6|nr:cilia- and flagella-associated protein 206 [Ostrinia furnacalis]
MACNENVVKNMANEITRNCQAQNVTVDPEFVIYLIDLLLLNPKYGKLFSKTISRNNLQYFVEECVAMLTRGDTSMNTMKMQFIIQTNYDKLQNLIDRHLESIGSCLRPLVTEILDEDPSPEDEAEFKKLFRKISIYIVLASGLGNPGVIVTLKEGMAALESVFSLNDLKMFVALPRAEKMAQLNELLEIVSGVRLFNRDCKKGGDGIPDLPFNLVDAGKACLASLSNSLITVMQRVNTLTTAIEDTVSIQDETGNVFVDICPTTDLTLDDYTQIFELLAFNRQYEVFIRKLLSDVETMVENGLMYVDKARSVLEELHAAVKYKAAVPVVAVFPLFSKLWQVWRAMQNVMFLVSTVNRLMSTLATIQDQMKIPYGILERMLKGRHIITDQDRMNSKVSMEERLSLGSLKNYVAHNDSFTSMKDRHIQFLGFCALCLSVGALVPSNMKVGLIKSKGNRYGFCSVKMAARFSKDPERYINEVLDYARNNPSVINLLNIVEEVYKVKDIDTLVTKYVPKIKVMDRDIQTEAHPIDEHIEKNYTWDMWEWKRRACQWASIVNCQTHSTQTNYSHLRSEIHCQTVEPRDKCMQTRRDAGVNTAANNFFLWGLRGQKGDGQHSMDLKDKLGAEKKKARVIQKCSWPCIEPGGSDVCTAVDKDLLH